MTVIPGGGGAAAEAGAAWRWMSGLSAVGVFLTILLWPTETAPAWMDTINPLTRGPYGSADEYEWLQRLSPDQTAYLFQLLEARKLKPDSAVDAETDPLAEPQPQPVPRPDRRSRECMAMPVPRRGGHKRHDAYATKVTTSPVDYYVRSGSGLAINYDGLQTGTLNVWEVKVGYGWFFRAEYMNLTRKKLGEWDAQKDRGLAVANSCGYVHLWAHPDRHVVQLLLARWGGVPSVLQISE